MSKLCVHLLWIMLLCSGWELLAQASGKGFYQIPAQQFTYQLGAPDPNVSQTFVKKQTDFPVTLTDFTISKQIKLEEYKQFVASQPLDQQTGLQADTTITQAEAYHIYWDTDEYDNYPVVGVSWVNAMSYCRWRTLQEQGNGPYTYYYVLPSFEQWLGAYRHLDNRPKKHDLNRYYSDWLYDQHHYQPYGFIHDINPDIRMSVSEEFDTPYHIAIGDSYRRQLPYLTDYKAIRHHKERGYPDLSFRIVKVNLQENPELRSPIDNFIIDLWELY